MRLNNQKIKKYTFTIGFSTVLLSCVSCIPHVSIARQNRTIEVIDASSKKPIVGAKLRIETWSLKTPALRKGHLTSVLELTTDEIGRVQVTQKKKLGIVMLAPDGGNFFADQICVEKAGYSTSFDDPFNGGDQFSLGYVNKSLFELITSSNTTQVPCTKR